MPVLGLLKAVAIGNLVVPVSAWQWTCDRCGRVDTFADSPMPEGHSEFDASRKGWAIYWDTEDNELCRCPSCRTATPAPTAGQE